MAQAGRITNPDDLRHQLNQRGILTGIRLIGAVSAKGSDLLRLAGLAAFFVYSGELDRED